MLIVRSSLNTREQKRVDNREIAERPSDLLVLILVLILRRVREARSGGRHSESLAVEVVGRVLEGHLGAASEE